MTVTDRTAATDAEFHSRIAPFESAPTPPEVVEARVVEEVARWLCERRNGVGGWDHEPGRRYWLEDAEALLAGPLAAYRSAQDGGAEEAVRLRLELARIEGRAESLNAEVHEMEDDDDAQLLAVRAIQWEQEAAVLRAALAPQAER